MSDAPFAAFCGTRTAKVLRRPNCRDRASGEHRPQRARPGRYHRRVTTILTGDNDGRELTLTRYTQPGAELKPLITRLKLTLPPQQPPKITAAQAAALTPV